MMRINVAGAGAGKTTCMASYVAECSAPEGKVIFFIAFTNAAIKNIEEKILKRYGYIPDTIRISTIHSFFYQELIQPYYYLLFKKHYQRISVINLPTDIKYRNARIAELDAKGYLHQTKIPEKAKWVVSKKANDSAVIRKLRSRILTSFSEYCFKIFVDEAQDIDEDMKTVLEALDGTGIDIELFGDPKQDVKGYNCYRDMIDSCNDVHYMKTCHRCPQKHLYLSNLLAKDSEKQEADAENRDGSICVYYESRLDDISALIDRKQFGLIYIHKKNDRFATRSSNYYNDKFVTLNHEIFEAVLEKMGGKKTEMEIQRRAYYVTEQMIQDYENHSDEGKIVNKWIAAGEFSYDKKSYAKICQALKDDEPNIGTKIEVRSIESIKGLEHERCLFILTKELAPYLFGRKTEDNKMRHLLYVALTRSLDNLSILVTKEVETIYSQEYITSFIYSTLATAEGIDLYAEGGEKQNKEIETFNDQTKETEPLID